jgi:tetratricopeptide (TPR) repeat protein
MSHYSEDELTAYVINPARITDRMELESHLTECAECQATVSSLEETEADLRQPEVWQQVDAFLAHPPRLHEALRLKRKTEAEDEQAMRLLERPLLSPLHFVDAKVGQRLRFRTAGVLRMLCKQAHELHDKNPTFSLRLAEAACAIAPALPPDPPTTRHWHGVALRERANALRYLGKFGDALRYLDEAATKFDQEPWADPFDLAIVGYIRGTILVQMEREEEALKLAEQVAGVFAEYGDESREAKALLLEGVCLDALRQFDAAAAVAERVIKLARALEARRPLAYALQNGGVASVELGQLDRAEKYLVEALVYFDEMGVKTECARVEWAMAGILTARGDLERAETMLDAARSRLQALGLRNDHGLATLEWVEVRLALKRTAGVTQACRQILMEFESEGMMRKARMALAYLQEALAAERATPQLVREVRHYLRDLPRHPDLVFAPARQ